VLRMAVGELPLWDEVGAIGPPGTAPASGVAVPVDHRCRRR
jgi:hypothetical protein